MSSKSYFRSSYRFLTPSPAASSAHPEPHPSFELDESDLYSPNTLTVEPSPVWSSPSRRAAASRRSEPALTNPSSLPVDVPDWSKILMGEYRKGGGGYNNDYGDGDEEEGWNATGRGTVTVPPHKFLARQAAKSMTTRVACSVHEGVGRTLKGRDLCRVRNAIWEKTGFQD
ncbi:hypothetical protein MLD38_011648 [Melastoma candidum]|uniref:Uncharacterized protein n=1 Tax=Melastoma candidum TaxID=119954 RepID=A0ACB9R3U2_9MYRT|nr:hypothetical protein MLD38_011648 [Melastoma candidum]